MKSQPLHIRSTTPTIKLDIAILGGGFAGVSCAQALGKAVRKRKGLRVGIISEHNHMVFQPMLAEVAGGTLSPSHVVNPIRRLCRHVAVYTGTVTKIDLDTRHLYLEAGAFSHNIPVTFERLFLALGAEIDLSRVPGMTEHAYLMQNVGDALRIRFTIISRCEEANLTSDAEAKRRLLTFVLVGGGYSGVETAGQILDLLRSINRYYRNIQPYDFRVVLVHSRAHILPTLSPHLGSYAADCLRQSGMDILLQRRVKAITASRVYLDNGQSIDSNTVISTVGNAPHSLVCKLCQRYNIPHQRGRIITNNTLQVASHPYLWAAGDCAHVPQANGSSSCPPTAQFAIRQGLLAGRNLLNDINNRPLKPFTFKGAGELAAIGHFKAVAHIFGVNISGFPAWFLWRTLYLMKLPGFERKLRVMLDWTLDLFFPKDINLINPQGTETFSTINLNKGDCLFNAGDPPFHLYCVIQGRIDLLENNRVVRSIEPGDFLGERALTKELPYIYTAIAAEPNTKVSALDAKVFQSLIRSSVELKRIFRRSGERYKTADEIAKIKKRLTPEMLQKAASEIMQPQLATLRETTTLAEALSLLKQYRHSSYPVLSADGKLTGVLQRDDIFSFLKSSNVTMDTPVSRIDYSHLPIVAPTTTTAKLMEHMLLHGTHKVLVADKAGQLRGIVTLMDMLIPDPIGYTQQTA